MMTNALVIDLEYWYSPELLRNYLPEQLVDQFPDSIIPLLEVLDKYNIHATFAVLGIVAEKHPKMIEDIYNNGHEIASHCWSHRTLHDLGKDGFENEIKKSVDQLESIIGEKPIGFRAPSFSIDNSTKWAFEILEKYGFKYDASIFPVKTMLYGISNAPLKIYRPSLEDVSKEDPHGRIVEFPMTVFRVLGKNIPIAGGFYLRASPIKFLEYGIQKATKDGPAILYIHPWEIYEKTPRLRLPLIPRFITYYGINHAFKKFEHLLRSFKFSPIRDVLAGYQYI